MCVAGAKCDLGSLGWRADPISGDPVAKAVCIECCDIPWVVCLPTHGSSDGSCTMSRFITVTFSARRPFPNPGLISQPIPFATALSLIHDIAGVCKPNPLLAGHMLLRLYVSKGIDI